jgi:ubiquinone/menaquinone biosynthesis C-methylase UbiE
MQALLTEMKIIDHNEPGRLDMMNRFFELISRFFELISRFFELVRVDGSNDHLREGDTVMDLAGGTGARSIHWGSTVTHLQ